MTPLRGAEAVRVRAEQVMARLPPGGAVVEVGVYRGAMGARILGARTDARWHGVDPWLPAEEQPAEYVATGDPHARMSRKVQLDNLSAARGAVGGFDDRATIHRMTSVDAAPLFADGSVDVVFLDGRHDYDGVMADIEAWWPKIKPRGWLGGHDYGHPRADFEIGVAGAVDWWAKREGVEVVLGDDMAWWARRS